MRNLACLALVLVLLSGCATTKSGDKMGTVAGPLEPQTIQKFSDIPVPVGFKLLPQESYCFESYGLRVGAIRYSGKADIDRVVAFYKEQMPIYNWRLLNIVEYGDRLLNFDRENETCIISLHPKWNSVVIAISVGPKSQSPYLKPSKPLK